MNLIELGWNSFFNSHFEPFMAQGLYPARVAREQGNLYLIYCESGESIAEVSGKIRHGACSKSDFPSVGDWVAIRSSQEGGRPLIEEILPRKSRFSRKVAGANTDEQIVAANVDTVFLMNGLDRDFNLRRIERYLILACNSGSNPVIVLNKSDICHNLEAYIAEVESIAFGVPIHAVSAKENLSLDTLGQYLGPGKTVAVLGSSGVGKSTLVNSLIGTERQKVNSVRECDGRGMHTTTSRELIMVPMGGMIIDTPGMRQLQMWAEQENLEETFPDIEELAVECRFRNCSHENEPGCSVKQAVEDGILPAKRVRNYIKIKKEMGRLAARQNQKAHINEKARWKKITKMNRKKTKG